jgi:hypothetical protein
VNIINKSYCKECKGSGLCEHDKEKTTVKSVKEVVYVNNNKQKRQCKYCDGGSFCEHGTK